jgi:large subunit ribosomal protein L1
VRKLADKYEFFIADAKLMPAVATTFGRTLGPTGKMPSPQLGILMNPDEKSIKELRTKINSSIKIRNKEPSVKVKIGKEKMTDDQLIENAMQIYNAVLKGLAKGIDNIKNMELKFTMTKPIKIKVR